jgi:beta-phosphoglucomutase-like phosphatase (HAD superfamily)
MSTTSHQKQAPSADEIFQAAFDAWTVVARKAGFALPDYEQVQFAMSVGPEEAILVGFEWTNDPIEAATISQSYKDALQTYRSKWQTGGSSTFSSEAASPPKLKENEAPLCTVIPGAAKWVKSFLDNEMQCGMMSYLERDQVDVLLEYAGLSSLFGPDKRVTSTSGYNRERQQMLGVALRIERRPDHCVVFDASPYAAAEAHDVGMKVRISFPQVMLATTWCSNAYLSSSECCSCWQLPQIRVACIRFDS